jgi:hypothetical protein
MVEIAKKKRPEHMHRRVQYNNACASKRYWPVNSQAAQALLC